MAPRTLAIPAALEQARRRFLVALRWYKKALAVDLDLGDAYYNMACVHALQGGKDLALRYLQIAVLDGYAGAEGLDAPADLAGLRGEPASRALSKAPL